MKLRHRTPLSRISLALTSLTIGCATIPNQDWEPVRIAIARSQTDLMTCLTPETDLAETAGSIELIWEVAHSGATDRIHVVKSDLPNGITECLRDPTKWRFDKNQASTRNQTIRVPSESRLPDFQVTINKMCGSDPVVPTTRINDCVVGRSIESSRPKQASLIAEDRQFAE